MSRRSLVICTAILASSVAVGQPRDETENDPGSAILSLARAAPPALGAEAILRLVDGRGALRPEAAKQAIEEVVAMAPSVKQPYPERYNGAMGRSSYQLLLASQSHKLRGPDQLSLLARAVEAMLNLDRDRAMELAEQTAGARDFVLPDAGCEDAWVPNLSVLYEMLAKVVQKSGAVASTNSAEAQVALVQNALGLATRSTELPDLGRLILAARPDRGQAQALTAQFSSKLREMRDGDPEFTIAMDREELHRIVVDLTLLLRKFELDPRSLIAEYRTFLLEQSQLERCAHVMEDRKRLKKVSPYPFDWALAFNRQLTAGKAFADLGIAAIDPQRLEPPSLDLKKEPRLDAVSSEESKYKRLMVEKLENPAVKRGSNDWNYEAKVLLSRLEMWEAESGTAEEQHFVEKCELYGLMLMNTRTTAVVGRAAESFIQFLSNHPVAVKNPRAWIGCFDNALHFYHDSDEDPAEKTANARQDALIESALRSRDVAVVVFAHLASMRD